MSRPASGKPPSDPPDVPPALPLVPDEATWAQMTPAAREAFVLEVLAALSDPAEVMSEGRRHKRAKSRALDELTLHFSTTGRSLYLADEMAVMYPGQRPFVPDILGVLGVEAPEDDPRNAWIVQDEGRGLDLVIEVLHRGNRDKDLVRNVEWYAALGIGEYFVYDRMRLRLHGFRLPSPGARRYREMTPRLGRLRSEVLELDLALCEGQMRFFSGHAELVESSALIAKLGGMMERSGTRIAELEARAAELEARSAELEARSAELEARATAAEQARAAALQRAVLGVLGARGLAVPEAVREAVLQCADPQVLERWILRAASVPEAAALLSGRDGP